ncbi:sensor histidine kinase [Salinibacter ruber]|uniref:sensor histidine kinase n=1 Tax=Salinibacter ruber TaxID=146919 RepID=UPI0013C31371|nr:HAMP domain-containing sensor histidine kinase [Salinibacter ruber]
MEYLRGPIRRLKHQWRARTLGLRLVGGYALLFTVSVVLLAALAYGLLIYFLQKPDYGFMEAEARELVEAYRRGGAESMQDVLSDSTSDERHQEILVRLADTAGQTVLLYNPDDWRPADLNALEREPPPAKEAWISLGPAKDGDPLGAFALRASPDRVLQVGMDADLRADVLDSMRATFLAIALPVVLLALLGGVLLAYRALRPLRRLVTTFNAVIETGDVHRRASTDDVQGEFTELVRLFNRMLARIERLVGRLRGTLDNVAHDLRTPMTRLRGRAERALQHEGDPEQLREALADTLEASDDVLQMLDAIMEVAEAESGTLQLRTEPVPVADVVDGVVEAYRLVADEEGVALDIHIPAGLQVTVDRRRMRQALANLLDNAVKYTPEGGRVAIRAWAREDGEANASVCIAVRDDGIGIPEDELPRIWDRLYRGDQSRAERGLGLGLSLVKAIVEAHDGHVDVESQVGEGTVFRVVLPRAAERPAR